MYELVHGALVDVWEMMLLSCGRVVGLFWRQPGLHEHSILTHPCPPALETHPAHPRSPPLVREASLAARPTRKMCIYFLAAVGANCCLPACITTSWSIDASCSEHHTQHLLSIESVLDKEAKMRVSSGNWVVQDQF